LTDCGLFGQRVPVNIFHHDVTDPVFASTVLNEPINRKGDPPIKTERKPMKRDTGKSFGKTTVLLCTVLVLTASTDVW
jgi:hypothetical protein